MDRIRPALDAAPWLLCARLCVGRYLATAAPPTINHLCTTCNIASDFAASHRPAQFDPDSVAPSPAALLQLLISPATLRQ